MIQLGLSDKIEQHHKDYLEGKINYLPFKPLGNFTSIFPGLMREEVTCFTGAPASSKTTFAKKLVVHDGVEWAIKNNKNFHIVFFGLEESKSQFLYSMLSYQGFLMRNLQYNIKDFLSIGRTIDINDLPKIKEVEKRVEKMLPYITYIDNVYNSYGMWVAIRNFASQRGTFYYQEKPVVGKISQDNSWDSYIPNDPEEFIVIVFDNLSFVKSQKDEKDQAEAIWNVVEYLRAYAANKLRYSVVIIHHQNADLENTDNRKQQTILPTEAGLAINKQVSRSYLNLIGIANPNKVNSAGSQPIIQIWDGHNLKVFGNYLRTINFIKSRFGESDVKDTVFFGGRTGWFETIPTIGTPEYTKFVENLKQFK